MPFSAEQLTRLRQMAGVGEDADEGSVLDALNTALEGRTHPPAAPSLPDGVVTIDAAQLDQLRADAQAGREARAQQLRDRREGLVASAVADGRIPPARREHWLAQLEADPGAEQVLAGLRPGLVPLEPIGHANTGDADALDAQARAFLDGWGLAEQTAGSGEKGV